MDIDLLPSFLSRKGDLIWCQSNNVAVLLVDTRHVIDQRASKEGYYVWKTTHAPCFGAWKLGEWVKVKVANASVKRVLNPPSLSNKIHPLWSLDLAWLTGCLPKQCDQQCDKKTCRETHGLLIALKAHRHYCGLRLKLRDEHK